MLGMVAHGLDVSFAVLWTVLCLLLLLPVAMWLSAYLRLYTIARKLPGPRGHLITGNLIDMLEPDAVFNHLNQNRTKFGKLFKLWFLNKLVVVMSDPGEVKFVVNELKFNNRPDYIVKAMEEFNGKGMLTMKDDEVYKTHKKILFPMFYPAMLKNFHMIFEDKSRSLCEKLSKFADNGTIDVFQYMISYTMEAICATIIGCDVTNMDGGGKEFIKAVKDGDNLLPILVAQPWLRFPLIQKFFADGRKLLSTQKLTNTFIEEIVSKKVKAMRDTQRMIKEEIKVEGVRREVPSMLDMIVRATETGSEKFTTEDIRDELLSFINAGFMTSGTTLAFLLLLLGIHQEVQEEVSAELEEVFGSSLREATTDDLARLLVLDRVIKETMRLFPPVPVIPRELPADILLPSGKALPSGTNLLVYVYQIQRDPDSYPDPDSFVPDRWRPENVTRLNPDAYIPFGTGSRTCIGFRYGLLQMKVTACNLLRHFKVTTDLKMADLRNLGISITLILNGGHKVQLHKK